MTNGDMRPVDRGGKSLPSTQTSEQTNRAGSASNLPSSGKGLAAFLLNVGIAVVMRVVSLPIGIINGIIYSRETKKTDTLKEKICVALWNDPRAGQFKETFNNDISNLMAFMDVVLADETDKEFKATLRDENNLTDLIVFLSSITDVKAAIAEIQAMGGSK